MWHKLPPDIQKVFENSIDWWSDTIYKESVRPEDDGRAMAAKAGVQFVKMDNAGLQKYDTVFDAENLKEAQTLDSKGYPGTKIYREARRLVKQYNK